MLKDRHEAAAAERDPLCSLATLHLAAAWRLQLVSDELNPVPCQKILQTIMLIHPSSRISSY